MQFAEEIAIVSAIESNREGDFVLLKKLNDKACGNCSSQSGCAGVFSFFKFNFNNKIKVSNSLALKQGDSVIVEMDSSKLLWAALIMYLLPLVFLFLFAFTAKLIAGEIASIMAGLVGLFGALLLIKKITQLSVVAELFRPKLIRKVINIDKV